MSENIKQAYLDKTTAQMKEWSARLDVIKARIAKSGASVRIEFHTQMEDLQKKEDLLKKKLEELRVVSADALGTFKSGMKDVWNEAEGLIKTVEGWRKENKDETSDSLKKTKNKID